MNIYVWTSNNTIETAGKIQIDRRKILNDRWFLIVKIFFLKVKCKNVMKISPFSEVCKHITKIQEV